MVGTGGIRYEVVSPEQVVCTIKNRRPMQNHIKSLHAVAMALLAETATGFVVGVNLPDDKMPLIKSLKLDYKKLAKGDMKAVATLTDEQRQQILTEPKGEVLVPVVITDATGNSPVEAEMLWAWVPKKRA
jgi:acyl-coenzyme A thioesterase PaaI-like protein